MLQVRYECVKSVLKVCYKCVRSVLRVCVCFADFFALLVPSENVESHKQVYHDDFSQPAYKWVNIVGDETIVFIEINSLKRFIHLHSILVNLNTQFFIYNISHTAFHFGRPYTWPGSSRPTACPGVWS